MKYFVIALALQTGFLFTSGAKEEDYSITRLELESLDFELPVSIRLSVDLAKMQRQEFKNMSESVGFNMAFEDARASLARLKVYHTWDGYTFLIDHSKMALWIRQKNSWRCLLNGLYINKTMGGAPPRLPVQYLGKGYFAFSETVPGDVKQKSPEGFAQALAVTFLVDSKLGKLVERSEAFTYDHNPPIKVPSGWISRYNLVNSKSDTPKEQDKK